MIAASFVFGGVAFAIAAGFAAVFFGADVVFCDSYLFDGVVFGAVAFGTADFAAICTGFFAGGAATIRRGAGSGCAPRATRLGVETPSRVRRRADSRARKRRVSEVG